jgi:predicted ThiF/HesA family dinucleotide-utilizing enzyme
MHECIIGVMHECILNVNDKYALVGCANNAPLGCILHVGIPINLQLIDITQTGSMTMTIDDDKIAIEAVIYIYVSSTRVSYAIDFIEHL